MTNQRPATCISCTVRLTARNRASDVMSIGIDHNDVCVRCFRHWELENEHNDGEHDTIVPGCPFCTQTYLDDEPAPVPDTNPGTTRED